MKNNILFIINYNSNNQISLLLQSSDLDSIKISHCVIYNNGEEPSAQDIENWNINFTKVNISFEVICQKNNGYGAAINSCISLIKSDYLGYEYAFFSNADIIVKKNSSSFAYNMYDAVGFPMYQNGNFIVSKITIFTPLIPFRFRKIFYLKPKYGQTTIVHGCFFGLRIEYLLKINTKFFEEYFLYWEETQFFYEISKLGCKVGISDAVTISHDGEKSVFLDNARYYMLRNGLFFYRHIYKSFSLFVIWYIINSIYAITSNLRFPFKLPSWYMQGISDYNNKFLGKRIL
jgi:GT2 family glycosyltransferase